MELKKDLIGANWNGKGAKVKIIPENIERLKNLGADVFEVKKAKKKKNDTPEQQHINGICRNAIRKNNTNKPVLFVSF